MLPPTDFNVQANSNNFAHSWQHSAEGLVSHYNVRVVIRGVAGGEVINADVWDTSLVTPPLLHNYTVAVRAVSVCGSESEPLIFNGM